MIKSIVLSEVDFTLLCRDSIFELFIQDYVLEFEENNKLILSDTDLHILFANFQNHIKGWYDLLLDSYDVDTLIIYIGYECREIANSEEFLLLVKDYYNIEDIKDFKDFLSDYFEDVIIKEEV